MATSCNGISFSNGVRCQATNNEVVLDDLSQPSAQWPQIRVKINDDNGWSRQDGVNLLEDNVAIR